MCRQNRRDRSAFTLIELMVVIGIAAVLAAMTVPVAKSLREGNRMMACGAHLNAIHQALKLYFLDERGVPPYELATGADPNDPDTQPVGPGLGGLYLTGYVSAEMTMHCPRHTGVPKTHPDFYHSYDGRDARAGYDSNNNLGMLNQYKYLPYRGEDDQTDPDYYRQLAPGTGVTTHYKPTWRPSDSAVVCWCDYHAQSFTRGGKGQYQVLYWGGQVVVKPESLFREAGKDAWRVRPGD
jgi:prepilin-type N-terminal cleavage/methylation domain-containing protein